jgi:hypothetical protein
MVMASIDVEAFQIIRARLHFLLTNYSPIDPLVSRGIREIIVKAALFRVCAGHVWDDDQSPYA